MNVRWLVIENIVVLAAFTCTAVFAPGSWKLLALATLLFINCYKTKT